MVAFTVALVDVAAFVAFFVLRVLLGGRRRLLATADVLLVDFLFFTVQERVGRRGGMVFGSTNRVMRFKLIWFCFLELRLGSFIQKSLLQNVYPP